jgi:hypothetical protein
METTMFQFITALPFLNRSIVRPVLGCRTRRLLILAVLATLLMLTTVGCEWVDEFGPPV